ncbi:MAG: hypothetical protein QOE65_1578 [Solirubrobacteraceae bacterium]|jgi:short subunit dehydrogenase-like uncharacterized protein|nr:hypothetical protein [Solirubrobacteraceae bacterium]
MGRIVLFGATGYTGKLAAQALIDRGEKPVLAARSAEKLEQLAGELGGGLETAQADVSRPDTVRALVERGDVLLTTVGPFSRWGAPAVEAAVAAGAHYIDSTGEPEFIRSVFERYGPGAQAAGCGLVTAFGYDWVPGNLAGALALRDAGEGATRLDVGYYNTGRTTSADMSGGTRASAAGAITAPSFAWRGKRIVTERGAKGVRSFSVRGKDRPAISVGSSEHFALPRLAPDLREVNIYLGWFGPASRPMQAMSLVASAPGVGRAMGALSERFVKGSTGGPDATQRAKSGSHVQAFAYDGAGRELAHVVMEGPNGYTLTGDFLAWGAARAANEGMNGTGALGPVDAFGLDELEAACAKAGLKRV